MIMASFLTPLLRRTHRMAARALAAAGFAAIACQAALAAPALSVSNTEGQTLTNPPFVLGWSFTVNSNVTVTSLGMFDALGDGFVTGHQIGIWNSAGTLLTSGSVSAGTGDTLIANFRYVDVADVGLTAGDSYSIGAVLATGDDQIVWDSFATDFVMATELTFGESRFASGSDLTNPTARFGSAPSFFGPNFLFESTPVDLPEPGSLVLVGLGLLGLMAARKRRQA